MKRFIDDKIWSDAWYCKLSSEHKLLWIYLFTNCSKIGIWEENQEEVEYRLRKKLDWDKTKNSFSEKVFFMGEDWIIKNFIALQYPNLLKKPDAPLHKAVFSELERKCLKLNGNSLYIDYIYPIHSLQVKVKVKEEVKEKEKAKEEEEEATWKTDYQIYLSLVSEVKNELLEDYEEVLKQSELNPGVDVKLTIEKAVHNFWGTEAGWKNKKASRAKEIDMRTTLINAISMQCNKVYLQRQRYGPQEVKNEDLKNLMTIKLE